MKKITLILLTAFICAFSADANNVNISNVGVVNGGAGQVKIKFDISWDNSWRVSTGQGNYDGVWVFFRYRVKGSNVWTPLTLRGSNNSASPDYSIYHTGGGQSGISKYGAIIHRTADGFGSVNYTNVQLGAFALPYNIEIKGFAIEMVYVPEINGGYLGDGDGTSESTNAFHQNLAGKYAAVVYQVDGFPVLPSLRTDPNPFDDDYINWENGKQLYVGNNGFSYSASPASIVNGFPILTNFWCMKYEVTQGAYRDFLNCLTVQQQTTRTAVSPSGPKGASALVASGSPIKSFIEIDEPATGTTPAIYGCDADNDNVYNEPNDGEFVACGYLSWPDLAAYLIWAGLAPMTETIYERICRGSTDAGANSPVVHEYAWGTSEIQSTRFTRTNHNTANESITGMSASATAGYANYSVTSPNDIYTSGAPLRNGIFASFSGADRITSGASFFGVMEMSGNVAEPCVTIGNQTGRLFRGWNGEGYLTTDGNAGAHLYWPGNTTNADVDLPNYCYNCEVTFSAGTILRGGNFWSNNAELMTSNRSQGAANVTRVPYQGGRGVLYCRD